MYIFVTSSIQLALELVLKKTYCLLGLDTKYLGRSLLIFWVNIFSLQDLCLRWRQQIPPKHLLICTALHNGVSQVTVIYTVTSKRLQDHTGRMLIWFRSTPSHNKILYLVWDYHMYVV